MELVINNFRIGKPRRERLHGRDYIVAPATLIVSGVLNGSKGALYYPQEELERDPGSWNGMPLVVYHPTDHTGANISARDPEVLDESWVGNVYRTKTHDGKLKAELWFDAEATKRVDRRVYDALDKGEPTEISTGLFTHNLKAREGSQHNGIPYDEVAVHHRPDHLAILPDQKGACSLQDGCGVFIANEATVNCGGVGGKPGPCPESDAADADSNKALEASKKYDGILFSSRGGKLARRWYKKPEKWDAQSHVDASYVHEEAGNKHRNDGEDDAADANDRASMSHLKAAAKYGRELKYKYSPTTTLGKLEREDSHPVARGIKFLLGANCQATKKPGPCKTVLDKMVGAVKKVSQAIGIGSSPKQLLARAKGLRKASDDSRKDAENYQRVAKKMQEPQAETDDPAEKLRRGVLKVGQERGADDPGSRAWNIKRAVDSFAAARKLRDDAKPLVKKARAGGTIVGNRLSAAQVKKLVANCGGKGGKPGPCPEGGVAESHSDVGGGGSGDDVVRGEPIKESQVPAGKRAKNGNAVGKGLAHAFSTKAIDVAKKALKLGGSTDSFSDSSIADHLTKQAKGRKGHGRAYEAHIKAAQTHAAETKNDKRMVHDNFDRYMAHSDAFRQHMDAARHHSKVRYSTNNSATPTANCGCGDKKLSANQVSELVRNCVATKKPGPCKGQKKNNGAKSPDYAPTSKVVAQKYSLVQPKVAKVKKPEAKPVPEKKKNNGAKSPGYKPTSKETAKKHSLLQPKKKLK